MHGHSGNHVALRVRCVWSSRVVARKTLACDRLSFFSPPREATAGCVRRLAKHMNELCACRWCINHMTFPAVHNKNTDVPDHINSHVNLRTRGVACVVSDYKDYKGITAF